MEHRSSFFYSVWRLVLTAAFAAGLFAPTFLAQAATPARVLDTDMSITMTDSVDPVVAGRTFNYVLTVGNTGSDVTEVTVTDDFPAGLDFLYATPSQGTCSYSGGTLTCELGAMVSGGTATVIVTVSANTGGTVSNTASVSANDTETDPSNNTATESTTVQTGDGTICYVVADGGNQLVTVDRATWAGTAAPNGLGVPDVEAIAYWPGTNTLYAADADDFGTIDTSTGVYTSIGAFGSADGVSGTINITDVDSLSFDPFTGLLYGTHRIEGSGNDDILIQIDPATGQVVPDAFGAGVDYVVIPAVAGLNDVDDIAVSSVDGTMYATQNDSTGDHLIIVNKTTGASTDVDRITEASSGNPIDDVEGLGYDATGNFYGTTGADSNAGYTNSFYTVDPSNAEMVLRSDLSSEGTDYESADCLVDGVNTIAGTVFEDAAADGVLSPSDVGTAGVTVNLYRDTNGNGQVDAGDVLVAAQDTDAAGHYAFTIAAYGDFVLEIDTGDLPAGHTMTTDNVETASFSSFGNADAFNDFGHVEAGFIGNYIWFDVDGDGVQDANEPGIAGVTVELQDGTCTSGVDCPTAVTDADGYYGFDGLAAGTYTVNVDTATLPAGATQTGDPDGTMDNSHTYTLASGEVYVDADFGYQGDASIGDRIWFDADGDGVQDAGENGIAGVTVNLYDPGPDGVIGGGDDILLATAVTDSSGAYLFDNLFADTYVVSVDTATLPAGATQTGDPDGTMDNSHTYALSAGENYQDADFGYQGNASIGDLVWYDDDGNGVQDAGETDGVSGVTVNLYDPGPDGVIGGGDDVLVATTTTGSDGSYAFDHLFAGNYYLNFDTPTGYDISPQDAGGDDAVDSDADVVTGNTAIFSLASGDTNNDLDAGLTDSELDYGDLPSTYNRTLLMNDGPRHIIGTLRMGANVDADPDGQENPDASADTYDDGVARDMSDHWTNNATVDIDIDLQGSTVSGSADVGMWLDWNGDGDFDDAGEFYSYTSLTVGSVNTVHVTVPDATGYTVGDTIFVRVRAFDPDNLPGGSLDSGDYVGIATNGEVEDYEWRFSPTAITLDALSAQSGSLNLPLALAGAAFVLFAGAGIALRKRFSA